MKQERNASRLSEIDPLVLLDRFDQDVRNGVNDEVTKSCLYSVMNRYFQNEGNIYEISGYVDQRSSLAFLRQANVLYPAIFQLISDHKLPMTASPGSLLAYLSYLETLERSGYAGIALRGTAAHQYAQLAYIALREPGILNPGINVTQNVLMKQNKALFFAVAAQADIVSIFEGKASVIPIRDRILGLRHYAVALRYFEIMGMIFVSPKTAREIFDFCEMTIQERGLSELEMFTGLLNASTLVLTSEWSVHEVRIALRSILDRKADVCSRDALIRRILLAKKQGVKHAEFGVFGKKNIVSLATKVPEFRAWLNDGGWLETDFEM